MEAENLIKNGVYHKGRLIRLLWKIRNKLYESNNNNRGRNNKGISGQT